LTAYVTAPVKPSQKAQRITYDVEFGAQVQLGKWAHLKFLQKHPIGLRNALALTRPNSSNTSGLKLRSFLVRVVSR
jgi:hypothetical protein